MVTVWNADSCWHTVYVCIVIVQYMAAAGIEITWEGQTRSINFNGIMSFYIYKHYRPSSILSQQCQPSTTDPLLCLHTHVAVVMSI